MLCDLGLQALCFFIFIYLKFQFDLVHILQYSFSYMCLITEVLLYISVSLLKLVNFVHVVYKRVADTQIYMCTYSPMFNVTVMMFRDMVESVMLLNDEDWRDREKESER